MNILICDDETQYIESLKVHIEEYMKNRFIVCNIVTTACPEEITDNNLRFDLAFLDIQMDGMDGISLAKELKERNNKIVLFFVTNFDEYQDDAMDLHAFRYFSKPFDLGRLYSGLDKAMEYIDGAYLDLYLYGDNAQQRVLVDDILLITRNMRKVFLKTKLQEFRLHESFDEFCEKLPLRFFYQVHKSYYINLHYVERYSYTEVYLTDGTRIPVAPRKQSAFHKYWFEYLKGR